MTTPRIGVNMRLEVQATLGTAVAVTNITKANPAVVTAPGHGFASGAAVVFGVLVGMVELDGQAVRVVAIDADNFVAEGLDTSNFTTFAMGVGSPLSSVPTVTKVATFVTWSNATQFDRPNTQPNQIDVSTLLDTEDQNVYGRRTASGGSVSTIFDPSQAAEALIKTASDSHAPMVFRATWAGGQVQILNTHVSGGNGFSQPNNDKATSVCYFTKIKQAMDYAS